MILVIDVCREILHREEFVRPILDILKDRDVLCSHYLDLKDEDLKRCSKVIICGTGLKDNEFLKDLEKFDWLKDFDKPVFGICAGFQILGLVFGGKLEKELEIGFFREDISSDFFGINGEIEVYHLHGNYIDFDDNWEIFNEGEIAQVVKHKAKDFYGVLFHPEVRNKEIILNFVEKV